MNTAKAFCSENLTGFKGGDEIFYTTLFWIPMVRIATLGHLN